MATKKSSGLGKGLESLFSTNGFQDMIEVQEVELTQGYDIEEIQLDQLRPNPYQPRHKFDEQALQELADSIQEHGIFQPIIVRKGVVGYDILAGERRFRASQIAGLATIPAIVKPFTEEQMMELALLENLQREDLTIIEEAQAYQMLVTNLSITQEALAKRVGKSRSHVTNTLRLLQLPKTVQNQIESGTLTMGHTKILIGLGDDQLLQQIVELIISENLNVRETEKLVRNLQQSPQKKLPQTTQQITPDIALFQDRLSQLMGTKAAVKYQNGRGKIEIKFTNDDDFNRILEALGLLEG
ncbi:MAG: ParB/RepB/Spo0J family partition protein [Culicoidibacterales bacterium]